MNKYSKGMRILAVLFLGMLFFLAVLETAIRITGAAYLSRQSLRNKQLVKRNRSIIILCYGDSVTECGRYPDILSELLKRRYPGVSFLVVNLGRAGTDSDYVARRIEEDIRDYKPFPDIVITMIGYNDAGEILDYGRTLVLRRPFLRTFNFVKTLWYNYELKLYGRIEGRELNARNTAPKLKKGRWCLAHYYFGQAEEIFKNIIATDPGCDEAYVSLGTLLYAKEDFKGAVACLKKAIEVNPGNSAAYYTLANFEFIKITFPTGTPILTADRGSSFAELGRLYGRAVELAPDDAEGCFYYLNYLRFMCDNEKFNELSEKFLKLKEKNKKLHDVSFQYLNSIFFQWHKDQILDKLLALNKNDPMLNRLLGFRLKAKNERKYRYYSARAEETGRRYYNLKTRRNYRFIRDVLKKHSIQLVAMQYPCQELAPLKRLLEPHDGVIFVDNKKSFEDAVAERGASSLFIDDFGGNFGHLTESGSELMAENVLRVLDGQCFR